MSSFTSSFKPWLLAAAVYVAWESFVLAIFNPDVVDRGSILEFSYAREETPQRLFIYHKLKSFAGASPTFIMSGDSSGFFGINPLEAAEQLPTGAELYNLSCCANLGFNGYFSVLEFMLDEAEKPIDYIILHVTPYTMPRPETWYGDGASLWGIPELTTFGETVNKAVGRPIRYLNPPSIAWRREVTWATYNLGGMILPYDRPLASFATYDDFLQMFERTRGWMPENDVRVTVASTECEIATYSVFDPWHLQFRPLIEVVFDAYADLARRYGARLIIAFQPVACTAGQANQSAVDDVERFRAANPDVFIPFPLITTWPSDRFSVPAHVKDEWRSATSERLGDALAEIVAGRSDAEGIGLMPR